MPTFAAVEGGGTTFVVALSDGEAILERESIETKLPEETIAAVVAWLKARDYESLGVAMFGPVDLDKASPTWGYITSTPKPNWKDTNVMGPLLAAKGEPVPCGFDTDVNAPALEEFRHYARPGESSAAYITIGTGIGIGLVVNGKCVKGLVHPEGGHIPVLKRPSDTYPGVPGHPHPWSLEGQCCAGAISARAGVETSQLKDLPDDHEVWLDVAWILGSMCATLTTMCSVERIVIGGGLMLRTSLFPKIRAACREILNSYIVHPRILEDGEENGIDGYIVGSVRGNDAGIFGAVALAKDAFEASKK